MVEQNSSEVKSRFWVLHQEVHERTDPGCGNAIHADKRSHVVRCAMLLWPSPVGIGPGAEGTCCIQDAPERHASSTLRSLRQHFFLRFGRLPGCVSDSRVGCQCCSWVRGFEPFSVILAKQFWVSQVDLCVSCEVRPVLTFERLALSTSPVFARPGPNGLDGFALTVSHSSGFTGMFRRRR